MVFLALAFPCLPFRLSHLPFLVPSPSPLFSGNPCPHPLHVCFLTGDNGPAGGLWNSGGTGKILTQTRQGRCCLLSYPVLPSPYWTLSPPMAPQFAVPCLLGALLASASSAWLPRKQELQLQSPVSAVQPRLGKRKSSSLHSLSAEPGAPTTSFREGTGTKGSPPPPWTQPKTIQWSPKSWS